MPMVVRYRRCEICNIKSARELGQKRRFMARFPLDEDRCRKWVKATGKEDLAYVPIEKLHDLKFICGEHFRPQDFNKKKTQLKRTAVPSLLLTAEPLSDNILKEFPLHIYSYNVLNQGSPSHDSEISYSIDNNNELGEAHIIYKIEHDYYRPCLGPPKPSISNAIKVTEKSNKKPQIQNELSPKKPSNTTTARERKLMKELQKRKDMIQKMKKKLNKIEKITSPLLKSIIETTAQNQKRKVRGKRWTDLHKSIGLTLYNISPKAYAYLREVLPMPCVQTLKMPLQSRKKEQITEYHTISIKTREFD